MMLERMSCREEPDRIAAASKMSLFRFALGPDTHPAGKDIKRAAYTLPRPAEAALPNQFVEDEVDGSGGAAVHVDLPCEYHLMRRLGPISSGRPGSTAKSSAWRCAGNGARSLLLCDDVEIEGTGGAGGSVDARPSRQVRCRTVRAEQTRVDGIDGQG